MRRKALGVLVFVAALSWPCVRPVVAQDFHFDNGISRPVLDNYLSRAITMAGMLQDDLSKQNKRGVDPRDNVRMILNIHAKFIGRSILEWGTEKDLATSLRNAKVMAEMIHKADPDIIL